MNDTSPNQNPVLVVTDLGIDDPIAERDELYAALTESGPHDPVWATDATKRLDHVAQLIQEAGLGTARYLGCWRAGCALRIAFADASGARAMDHLSNEVMRGPVAGGAVITAPNPDGADANVSLLFLLARQQ